jgi:hypothetical protein
MPILTPNFLLPVPGPLDEPCDFAEQWCDFTDSVQVVLDRFEAVADRTNPVVPLAKMEVTTPVTIAETSTIPYDTLTLNNAGMVNFDTSNTTIVVNRPGRFFFTLNVMFVGSTTNNVYFQVQYQPTGAGTINRTYGIDEGFGATNAANVGMSSSAVIYVTTPPANIRTTIQLIGVDENIRIDTAAFSAFWFADRGAP